MEFHDGNPALVQLSQYRNSEEMEMTRCKVQGAIPTWLNGHMIRNGPGEFQVGSENFKHWFDGHAIMHKFDISDGKVFYSSKFIQAENYKTNHKHNRIINAGFGTPSIPDPCQNVFARFFSKFFSKPPTFDTCNVNVTKLGDAYYAITDAAVAFRMDPGTLETKKFLEYGKITHLITNTGHPHYDINGDYYNLSGSFGFSGFYAITKIAADDFQEEEPLNNIRVVAKIPIKDQLKPSYFHSFAITLNYFAIHDQPVRMNATNLIKASFTWEGVMNSFIHEPDRESVFHVIDRKTMEPLPTKYASKGRFSFHHINSYDEDINGKRYLVMDILCSDGVTLFYYWMEILEGAPEGRKKIPHMSALRFVLPLDVSTDLSKGENLVEIPGCQATAVMCDDGSVFLTPEKLMSEDFCETSTCKSVELPQINYKDCNQRKYKFFYCIGENELAFPDRLLKVDVSTKDPLEWMEKGRIPSEPVFVKRPGGTEEDDGVILSTVLPVNLEDPIFLLILDAKSFKEIARAVIKTKLSFPFHGSFTSRNELK